MISKQVLLGTALALGGGLVVYSMVGDDKPTQASQEKTAQEVQVVKPVVQPLTADVATEERLLAQKQKEREAHEQQVQKQTQLLLAEQEKARANALNKANESYDKKDGISAESASKSEVIAAPTVQTRPEAIEIAKKAEEAKKAAEEARKAENIKNNKNTPTEIKKTDVKRPEDQKKSEQPKKIEQTKKSEEVKRAEEAKKAEAAKKSSQNNKVSGYQVKSGDTWTSIAKRYGVTVSALTEANGVNSGSILRAGATIKVPNSAQLHHQQSGNKSTGIKKTENKKPNNKSSETKKSEDKKPESKVSETKKSDGNKGRYTVQVAISPDKAKVDELVGQYRAAGYQVSTSNTSRGIRVLIGSERTEEGAKALKSKINKDSRVKSSGAWIHQTQ